MFAFRRGKLSVLWDSYSLFIYTRLIMRQDISEYSCRSKEIQARKNNKVKLYLTEKDHQLSPNIRVGILTELSDTFRSFIVQGIWIHRFRCWEPLRPFLYLFSFRTVPHPSAVHTCRKRVMLGEDKGLHAP